MTLVPNVYAGDKYDWHKHYDDLEEGSPVFSCWSDGFIDGQDHPFNGDRHRECIFDVEKPYYEAFIIGCNDAGNTKADCERSIE